MKKKDSGPTPPERVYTVAQASRFLQIREPLLREEIRLGRLKAARIGRLYRIREADLSAYFERHLVTAEI